MNKKDDINAVKKEINAWLFSLDNGDLQGMLDTCDANVITANEKSSTTMGIQHISDKYGPRIEAATFKSSFETDHIEIYDNFALVVGRFEVQMTNKKSGEVGGGTGRLALGYHRNSEGAWKMVFDMDNNA